MSKIEFKVVLPDDSETIQLIAEWYLNEWNIPTQITSQKLNTFSTNGFQFQVLMKVGCIPVATGGLYNHVGLIDKEPTFSKYKNWLALVYTQPENRNKGLGALVCCYIQDRAKTLGLQQIYLFTHTAETLYSRLAWLPIDRLKLEGKNIVVMKKDLI